MEAARKTLLKQADGNREVRWQDLRQKARAPKAHRTTISRSFARSGLEVERRRPREKLQRTPGTKKERVEWCRARAHLTGSHFADRVDLIIDNKQWLIPTSDRTRKHLSKQRVRFHLRKRSEGLQSEMTKPNRAKNRVNTGGSVKVCAGISRCRIVLWEYLPARWSGKAASDLYRGPVLRALQKSCGVKRKYSLMEDNDPQGYKSRAGVEAKIECKIQAMDFPKCLGGWGDGWGQQRWRQRWQGQGPIRSRPLWPRRRGQIVVRWLGGQRPRRWHLLGGGG